MWGGGGILTFSTFFAVTLAITSTYQLPKRQIKWMQYYELHLCVICDNQIMTGVYNLTFSLLKLHAVPVSLRFISRYLLSQLSKQGKMYPKKLERFIACFFVQIKTYFNVVMSSNCQGLLLGSHMNLIVLC